MYNKSYLKKLNFKFDRNPTLQHIEITFDGWFDNYRYKIRVVQQGEYFAVAEPGMGGTFNLSYQYILGNVPIKGFGFKKIQSAMGTRSRKYRVSQKYLDMVVSAINIARKMLLEEN